MGLTRTVYDWLGKRLDVSEPAKASGTTVDSERCMWMEVARRVMASYVTSAFQLCEIKFDAGDDPSARETAASASWLWNVSPNPDQSASEFRADMLERLLVLDGYAVVATTRRAGHVQLYVADGGTMPEIRPGSPALYRQLSIQGSTEVLRGPLTSADVYRLDMGGIGGGWHRLQDMLSRYYDSIGDVVVTSASDRAGRKWILHLDQSQAGTEKQQENFNAQMQSSVLPWAKSSDGILPLYRGQTIERASADVSKSAGDAASDISTIRHDMFSTVAACFHMPASILEGNVNNFSATLSAFLTFAVDPIAEALGEEITRKTFTREQWAAGARAVVDTTTIKHTDLFDAADSAAKLVGTGATSPNEIRKALGLPPIAEPWADGYQMTKNNEQAGGGETNGND